jgi:RNA polymerase sigma factor (TIGR02999 family)
MEELFPVVYGRLRELAGAYLRKLGPAPTMNPTTIVHEAFIKLADRGDWKNRTHLLGVAAVAMRGILVDHARRRSAKKRGGGQRRLRLSSQCLRDEHPTDALAIHELLDILAGLHARQAKIVELRFFGGMSIQDVAAFLDVSESTVEADWRFARAWLSARLQEGAST